MRSKNIVIAPCGNKSTIFNEYWLRYGEERAFEVCLLFYHEHIDDPGRYAGVDHFYHLKDFKYHMLHRLFTEIRPEWLEEYDHFYFLDDDIEIDTRQINRMFALSEAMGSAISCAALTRDSFCSWPMFKAASNSFCRFVGQIEVMAPLFDSDTLRLCLDSFKGNLSSWGIDSVWAKLLGYPEDRLIIFDEVTMRHTQPVGKGELYRKLGKDPYEEWADVTRRYGAKKQNYREYGRLMPVSRRRNSLYHLLHKMKEWSGVGLRTINDYDLPSRVKSKLGIK